MYCTSCAHLCGWGACLHPQLVFVEDPRRSLRHTCFLLVRCFKTLCNCAGQQNVIVCVLDATSDWDNAAAISYARRYDPSGERTLFVITKIDRVESGLRSSLERLQRDHLRNQLPLGYVLASLYAVHHLLGMCQLCIIAYFACQRTAHYLQEVAALPIVHTCLPCKRMLSMQSVQAVVHLILQQVLQVCVFGCCHSPESPLPP